MRSLVLIAHTGALVLGLSAGCLDDVRSGTVPNAGDTVGSAADAPGEADVAGASDADVTVEADVAVDADVAVGADAAPLDTAQDTTPPDATPGSVCCAVGTTPLFSYVEVASAAACADQCGEPADSALCADPPVCCTYPDAHTGKETTSSCAAKGGVPGAPEDCWWPDDVCCYWPSGGWDIAAMAGEDVCAASGGSVDSGGDFCWDAPALGTQCCQKGGVVERVADYQCEVEGGTVVPFLTCWTPPTVGTCCALHCGGVMFAADNDACTAAGGEPVGWEACDPAP